MITYDKHLVSMLQRFIIVIAWYTCREDKRIRKLW